MDRSARKPGHEMMGAMDPDAPARDALAKEFGRPVFEDAGACLDAVRPDVALIAGKHVAAPGYVLAHPVPGR